MSKEFPEITNKEYKKIEGEDVIERATQELVDAYLRENGKGQDYIKENRPFLVKSTREKVSKIYEGSRDMFENNFPNDASGDTEMDKINSRAKALANLFDQKGEKIEDLQSGEVLDGEFPKVNTSKDAAVAYVMDLAGTDDIEKIDNFDRQIKNAEALIDIFKATDPFSYSHFQSALVSGDLTAAVEELNNFRKRQLGEDREEMAA